MDRDRPGFGIGLDALREVTATGLGPTSAGADHTVEVGGGASWSRRRKRSSEWRKSSGRTGAPFEKRMPRRSRKTYVFPSARGAGPAEAGSATSVAPPPPPPRRYARSPSYASEATNQLWSL